MMQDPKPSWLRLIQRIGYIGYIINGIDKFSINIVSQKLISLAQFRTKRIFLLAINRTQHITAAAA